MAIDRKYLAAQTTAISGLRSEFWSPKAPGKYKIRLTDGWSGSKSYFVDVTTHFNVGPSKARVICSKYTSSLAKTSRECPVCDQIVDLLTGSASEQALGKLMRPNTKYLMNIFVRPSSIEAGGMRIGQFPKRIHDQILSYVNETDEYGEISDPVDGRDILIERVGSGFKDTEYYVKVSGKVSLLAATEKEMETALSGRPDLTSFVVGETVAAIIAKLDGKLVEDDEKAEAVEEEEEVAPVKGKKKVVVSEEAEEAEYASEEAEAEEEEEEDAAPVKTKSKKDENVKSDNAKGATAASFAAIKERLNRNRANG